MPPNLLPMVSTGKRKSAATRVAASSATIEPGTRGKNLGMKIIRASEPRPTASAVRLVVAEVVSQSALHACEELAGIFLHRQAEEIFDLRGGDQQGDAVGESDDDGAGDETHGGAEAGEAEEEQNHAGHHGDHEESGEPVFG